MKDKGVIAFTAVASLGVLALMAAPALPGSQAAKDAVKRAAAPAPAPIAKNECTKEAWVCAAEKHEIKMRWSCEDLIKKGLKNPRSYQANEVRYWPSMAADPALVMIKIQYNAENSFGGSVRGSAVCHAAADGTIVGGRFL